MREAALKVRGLTWTPPGDEEPLWADGSEGRAALWVTHSAEQRARVGGRTLELGAIARLRS